MLHLFPLLLLTVLISTPACDENDDVPVNDSIPETPQDTTPQDTITPEILDTTMIYKPLEYRSLNWNDTASKFCWDRSEQSDHFIVLWEKGFGLDPNSDDVPSTYRVDIDALLEVAEAAYDEYVYTLGFVDLGVGTTQLDKYKMMLMLFYTTDWTSYGGGYDNVIGAIWQNPATMQPPGSTIAHEIGHAFQYQTACDLLAYGGVTDYTQCGYRYGWGGTGGNSFWEQCAQWQSYQLYMDEAFSSYNFTVHMANYHRHFCHEWQRYASYWLHFYWADKRGYDFLGKLWRQSVAPEDPIETYMKVFNLTVEDFNDELYDAAAHLATFDIDAIREKGANYIGQYEYGFYDADGGGYQVAYAHCPQTSGYNIVPLNIPDGGTEIKCSLTGIAPGSSIASDDPGEYTNDGETLTTTTYNSGDASDAGWRFGYVALLNDGTRDYSSMYKSNSTTSSVSGTYTVPSNCEKLYLIVSAAATEYSSLSWDENEKDDPQWPYKVEFENTNILGNYTIDEGAEPYDTTLTIDVSFAYDASSYSGTKFSLTSTGYIAALGKALAMTKAELASNFVANSGAQNEKIVMAGIKSDGSYLYDYTATSGYWFDLNGDLSSTWGTFVEYDPDSYAFSLGQAPGACTVGNTYTDKVAFVYYKSGVKYTVTFIFNITIT